MEKGNLGRCAAQWFSRVQKKEFKETALPEASGFGLVYSYSEAPECRSWAAVVFAILERAEQRMGEVAHPGRSYVDQAKLILSRYETYFATVRPIPFLDDTTTKNVLVDKGRLSGVVDVDRLCFGDSLLTVGLPQTALLAEADDVDYVEHWMNLLELTKQQRRMVEAYTLLFCVEFMSELGQRFNKEEQPNIDLEKFARLESVFETLAG